MHYVYALYGQVLIYNYAPVVKPVRQAWQGALLIVNRYISTYPDTCCLPGHLLPLVANIISVHLTA